MDRKTFFTAGGAIALTVVAASSAMAVNLGILDSSSSDKVGDLQIQPTSIAAPTTTAVDAPEIIHITVRDLPPVTTTPASPNGAPAPRTAAAPVAVAASPPAVAAAPAVSTAAAPAPKTTTRVDDDDKSEHGSRPLPRAGHDDDD